MRVWDIETGQELRRFSSPASVKAIAISPDGKWVLSGGEDGITRLWSLTASPHLPIFDHGSTVNALVISPDGKLILTAGGISSDGSAARLWNAATGQKLQDFKGHTASINYGAVISPDGKYIVTAGWDQTMRVWDAQTGQEVRQFVGHPDYFNDLVFSPDGRSILTAGEPAVEPDGEITGENAKPLRLWEYKTGQEIRRFGENNKDYYLNAVFSPDGKSILAAANILKEGKTILWDVATGRLIREYPVPPGGSGAVAFSPDGKTMLTAGTRDGILRLWDVETGEEIREFIGHTGGVPRASFSPDGRIIVTASGDKTARLWDIQTGQELRRFIGHTAGLENAEFSPDGKYLLTGSDDGTAMLWDVDYRTTMQYLCSRLVRDFTGEERAQYGITSETPTCPIQ